MIPKYITIHNTGNTKKGAGAYNHALYMSGSGSSVSCSYHFVVDDKSIYQLIPCNEVSWHAGDGNNGKGNRKSISIEICENSDGNLRKATDNAVELVQYLMDKYNIDITHVVQHNYWSGKNCPNRLRKNQPYSWDTFINKCENNSLDDFKVKILCDELNIRKTPNWNSSDVVGTIKDKGIYTIVDTVMLGSTKFGKLKSGAGYISLNEKYVKVL